MKLDQADHMRHDWRVHTLARDFTLLDVWRYPIVADPATGDDFAAFCRYHETLEATDDDGSMVSRALFKLRGLLGRVFSWDEQVNTLPIPGCAESSLRERLSAEEQRVQPWFGQPESAADTFTTFRLVYSRANEQLRELSNGTVHALMHLGWVAVDDANYAPQIAVYVKTRGLFGRLYMAMISPFRHLVIYPALMRRVKRGWQAREPGARAVEIA